MHKLGDTFYLLFPTHDATGALSDADATPILEVFEDASDSAMAYLPPVAKVGAYTGYYRATIVATGANGFEVGKSYNFMSAIKMDGTNIASRIDVILSLQTYDNDDLKTVMGTPVALDAGTASIAGMLVKMADDNGGADFNAGTDSLKIVSDNVDGIKAQTDILSFTGNDVKATLDGEKVSVSAMDNDVITVAVIKNGAIDAATFAAGAIDAAAIAHDAITSDKIADDALEPGMFSAPAPADVLMLGGDASSAGYLKLQYDGTGVTGDTFPARQDQISRLAVGSAAIAQLAGSFTLATGSEVGGTTYANTFQRNGVYHQLADAAGTLDGYYEFGVGADGVPVNIIFWGRVTGPNDTVGIYGWDWVAGAWKQIGSWVGQPGTTDTQQTFPLLNSMVGTGGDSGKVRVRVYGTGLTSSNFYNDFMYVNYSIVYRSVGYADGSVWVKATGNSGTTQYINGTADNPCPWADAVVIAAALGLARFRILNGETVTLLAGLTSKTLIGKNWNLALGGQSIAGCYIEGATITGIGSAATPPMFQDCKIGVATIPPSILLRTGVGAASGVFTGAAAGSYEFVDCYSLVGSGGTPTLRFAGLGPSTYVQMRRWTAGSDMVLDADCACKIDALGGGIQTIDVGGGTLSIRGTCKGIAVTQAIGSAVDVNGVFGAIGVTGTGGSLTIHGVCGDLTDTSGGAVTVTNHAVNLENVNVEVDTALSDVNLDHLMKVACTGADVVDNTALARMVSSATPADWDTFVNTTDALQAISDAISSGAFTVADIWEYIVTGLEPVGSSAELLTIAAGGPSITADAIARALLASPQADYMLDGTIGRSLFEASHGRVTPVIKNPVGDHIVDVDLSGVLRDKGALDRTACVAIAMDKTGRDSTSTLISRIVYLGQKARITLRGGEVAKAPYSVRIVVRTTLGFSYQHEIQVYVLGG